MISKPPGASRLCNIESTVMMRMKKYQLPLFVLMVSVTFAAAQTITLRKYAGNLKVVEVTIGTETYPFLFDTGGGDMFITPELCGLIGKRAYGQLSGYRMNGEMIKFSRIDALSFMIGSEQLFCPEVGVWDLMKLLPPAFPKIYGVVSLKSFHDRCIRLDLRESRITILDKHDQKIAAGSMTELPVVFSTGVSGQELNVFLPVSWQGTEYHFLFDTGNIDKVLVSRINAIDWNLQADSTTTGRKELGKIPIEIAHFQDSLDAASTDIIYDGVLGFEFIARHVFILDLKAKRVWMK